MGQQLVADGVDVLGTTTTPERCAQLTQVGIHPVLARLDQVDALRDVLSGRDTIILTIAAGRGRGNYHDVYATGSKNIVATLAGTSVRRLIYTSSTRVYGEDAGAWVDEDTPTLSVDGASAALIEAEQRLLDGGLRLGVPTSILRLGGIHGVGRELSPRICAAAGSSRSDGDAFVNLIDARDLVAVMAALTKITHHGILNVVDGAPMLRRELYDGELLAKGLPPISWDPPPEKKLGKRVRNDRVTELLGLSFSTPQTDGGSID